MEGLNQACYYLLAGYGCGSGRDSSAQENEETREIEH